jgi:hypothetical protein
MLTDVYTVFLHVSNFHTKSVKPFRQQVTLATQIKNNLKYAKVNQIVCLLFFLSCFWSLLMIDEK